MSAAGQHQPADEYKDHLKHPSILSLLQGAKQSITHPVLIVANDRCSTRTNTGSVTSAALRASSSRWPSSSAERSTYWDLRRAASCLQRDFTSCSHDEA